MNMNFMNMSFPFFPKTFMDEENFFINTQII